jgi:hypothetical protein
MIVERKRRYDAAVRAANTARKVADELELHAEELIDAIPDSVRSFKKDFDKVCAAAVWTTDFEDEYDPEEQWEYVCKNIQSAGWVKNSTSIAEEKLARITCYVNKMNEWLSETTTGKQPGFDNGYQVSRDSHYELQVALVDEES